MSPTAAVRLAAKDYVSAVFKCGNRDWTHRYLYVTRERSSWYQEYGRSHRQATLSRRSSIAMWAARLWWDAAFDTDGTPEAGERRTEFILDVQQYAETLPALAALKKAIASVTPATH